MEDIKPVFNTSAFAEVFLQNLDSLPPGCKKVNNAPSLCVRWGRMCPSSWPMRHHADKANSVGCGVDLMQFLIHEKEALRYNLMLAFSILVFIKEWMCGV